ncbi:hypothetical protein CVD28_06235 [Bacillus sp. M6-12]|uniref:hypothetical protein n=1 Tax=Bacillus sp. M6-12 TaxID=2054166 RepID=UPI000C75AF8B|nr:hypothetical protein [Bacillus sp. M6-12]PLS18714.1 hypothetical protein CVD28_06235 [Bacillus sp. M6-12]
MLTVTFFAATPETTAYATSNSDAWKKAGIDQGKKVDDSAIYDDSLLSRGVSMFRNFIVFTFRHLDRLGCVNGFASHRLL